MICSWIGAKQHILIIWGELHGLAGELRVEVIQPVIIRDLRLERGRRLLLLQLPKIWGKGKITAWKSYSIPQETQIQLQQVLLERNVKIPSSTPYKAGNRHQHNWCSAFENKNPQIIQPFMFSLNWEITLRIDKFPQCCSTAVSTIYLLLFLRNRPTFLPAFVCNLSHSPIYSSTDTNILILTFIVS